MLHAQTLLATIRQVVKCMLAAFTGCDVVLRREGTLRSLCVASAVT